jgi:pimeloyl-ACP methyl ester carboxylesterase
LSTPQPDRPEPWWARALRHETSSHRATVGGAALHYRVWRPDREPEGLLLLVHGYRGHSHWWDWIAPAFTDRFTVAALDLSGMGESGARAQYTPAGFAADVLGVLEALGASGATVIGHSYGGLSVLGACAIESDRAVGTTGPRRIGRAIILDSRVRFADRDPPASAPQTLSYRAYPSYEAIRARYRLEPEQPVAFEPLLDHIARHSIRETSDGWRWTFDPKLPFAPHSADGHEILRRVDVPVEIVFGELSSVVDLDRATATVAALPQGRGPIAIPQAQHHLMLDQPLALIAALRALLAGGNFQRS